MKFRLKIIFVILFSSFPVWANNNGGLFVAGLIGGAVATSHEGFVGQLPEELADWQDPATQSTSKLNKQCGLLTEFKLLRTGTLNFVFLGIRNESGSEVILDLNNSTIAFSSGKQRTMLNRKEPLQIKNNWYSWGFLPIPRKSDFKGQISARVEVPLIIDGKKPCALIADFSRNQNTPEQKSSYIEAPVRVTSLGLGGVTTTSGKFKDYAGKNKNTFEVYMAGFSEPESGFYLNVSINNFADPKTHPDFENISADRATYSGISFGKTWRIFSSHERLTHYLNIGPEIGTYQQLRIGSDAKTVGAFGAFASYTLDINYSRQYAGFWRGYFSVGLTPFIHATNKGVITGINLDLLRLGL